MSRLSRAERRGIRRQVRRDARVLRRARRQRNIDRRRALRAHDPTATRLLWVGGYGLVFLGIVAACLSNNVLVAALTLLVAVGYHAAAVEWLSRNTRPCANAWRVADDRRPVQPCDCHRCR
ncbi:membrane protein [Streptomyces phage Mischief19]|nr:membrane protein [Streptomyces phage Mischief19]